MNKLNFTPSTSFIEYQKWIYSTFAGVSMAFFLSLFSAGSAVDCSTMLIVSIYLFATSLTVNSILTFMIFTLNNEIVTLATVNKSNEFRLTPIVAIISFISGILSLIAFFNTFAAILMFFIGAGVFKVFHDALKEDHENTKSDSNS